MVSNQVRIDLDASASDDHSPTSHARGMSTVSTKDAAVALGISEQAVRRAISRGVLAARKQGRGYHIHPDELARYAQQRQGISATPHGEKIVALPNPAPGPTLPSPATRFIGRSGELAALVALLHDPAERIVTLTGPGGIGKTRLALAAAAQVREHFPDGVVFVDLTSVTRPHMVTPAIAQSFGLRQQPGRDQQTQIVTYLQGKRLLLLLDNAEQVLEAAPHVAKIVANVAGLAVLVTSRAPLRVGGERVLRLPPLSLPADRAGADVAALLASDAGRLFFERAREQDAAYEVDEAAAPIIADICARLDGLPLAIELAAARSNVLSPRLLRDRLEARLPALASGMRDAPPRHLTMRNAIAWSYNLLTPTEQRLFRQLAIFAGGFTLEAAEGVGSRTTSIGPPTPIPLDQLDALLNQSMVVREVGSDGEPRFRLLETIREYGLERLAEDAGEEGAVRRAHASYFLRFAQTLRPVPLRLATEATVSRMAVEAANLRQAANWLDAQGGMADLASITSACYLFWYAAGFVGETEFWLERALAGQEQIPAIERGRLLNGRAELLMMRGESERAEAAFAAAITILRGANAPIDLSLALIASGDSLNFSGEYQAGEALLSEGLALAETIADETQRTVITADAWSNLSNAARGLGQLDLAAARSEEALRRYADQGFELSELRTLEGLGHIARDQGHYYLALGRYQHCLARVGEEGELRLIAAQLEGIATIATAWGQPRAALLLFGAAAALREREDLQMRLSVDTVRVEGDLAALRVMLGEQACQGALAEGRALSVVEAIALAATVSPAGEEPGGNEEAPAQRLTRRERDILDLLSQSLTDREIGEALFLSRRTVNWHMRSILTKVGATSRRDVVAQARAKGLMPS